LHGRSPLVSLQAASDHFLGLPSQDWPDHAKAFAKLGLLPDADAVRIELAWWFGRLIGNTDMHFGNLSLFVDDLGRLDNPTFTLAPVYDMLPMRYRPSEFRDELGYSAFTPPELAPLDAALREKAALMARAFWLAMSEHAPVSADFRRLAKVQAKA
jgi:hypothetical protein